MSRALLCVLFATTSLQACAVDIARRPNVVLILADDLGYGDPRVYNPESKIPTPHIDRLAAEGLRFTDAHTPSSVCTPTRYGLLTGRYPWRSRLKSGVLDGYSPSLIEPGRTTIASLLAADGYRTACIGKWHLGLGAVEPADYAQEFEPGVGSAGFAESFVLPASLDMPPYVFVENDRTTVFPTEAVGGSKMRRHGGGGFWREGAIAPGFEFDATLPTITERAVSFIERQQADKSFFLYLPLTAPHTPWMPTAEFRGRSAAGYYGDFVAQVDASLGRVLDALEANKLANDTLVIFTSDNGAHWTPEDIAQWRHRANGRWRGQKADIWEGGHRVPFVVRWPGVVTANSKSDQLLCLTDCLATIAEIVQRPLKSGEAEDSISFAAVLNQSLGGGTLRDSIIHQSADGTLAIRQGTWKLATKLGSHGFSQPKNVEPKPDGPRGQLYDLGTDPAESQNLWLRQPQRVSELETLLNRCRDQGFSRPQNR